MGLILVLGRSPGGEGMAMPSRFLPGKSHGQRSLAGYSQWGCKEADTTEQLNNNNSGENTMRKSPGDTLNGWTVGHVNYISIKLLG